MIYYFSFALPTHATSFAYTAKMYNMNETNININLRGEERRGNSFAVRQLRGGSRQ